MLSFSKDREPALEPADLNETVADVVELMQSRAKELNVALDWRPGADLTQVLIDPDGIHRAVLNIVTNAIDAAEGVADARVTVATAQDDDDEVVLVTVADNGVGINEADIASIFQVFASTKGARGTGLGLPVSQKIVREHGGKIVVTSRPGQGSQFAIDLPMKRPEPNKETSGTGEVPIVPG
jgi:signal transduction histidine kinase